MRHLIVYRRTHSHAQLGTATGRKRHHCTEGVPDVGMPRFGSELWFEPEPSRTGPKFGPGFGVGAEPDQRSRPGFGGGPNLAEPFRTGSEPRTGRSACGAGHVPPMLSCTFVLSPVASAAVRWLTP